MMIAIAEYEMIPSLVLVELFALHVQVVLLLPTNRSITSDM